MTPRRVQAPRSRADWSTMGKATTERWAPVPGHPGYEVSDRGRARSLDRVRVNIRGVRCRYRGQPLRTWPARKGYLMVRLGAGRAYAVHRLVLSAFVGPCPDGMEGCHNDGDTANARLTNLRWDTHAENQADIVR